MGITRHWNILSGAWSYDTVVGIGHPIITSGQTRLCMVILTETS